MPPFHAYYTCTLDTVLDALYCFGYINTHILISTRHLAFTCHLLGSFWLPWTCMFRFWSLDWSGALHRRSSLSLGAGKLVLPPSVPESSCKLGDLLSPSAPFCCTNCNSYFCTRLWYNVQYQYITLCDNFVILMLECIYATCFCTLLLACTDT